MDGRQFEVAPPVLARVAAAPVGRTDVTRVALAPDEPGYPDRLADHLRRLIAADPLLCEAIEVSSSSLAATLERVRSGRTIEPRKLERAVLATTRYLLRMGTRPTPFGLLAGVAAGSVGGRAKVRIGAQHARSVRVDGGWLAAVVDDLQGRPEVRRTVRLMANGLVVTRGDRLVLTFLHCLPAQTPQPVGGVSIRRTPAAVLALDRARRPVAYPDLAEALAAAFPQASSEAVDRLLAELIDMRFLITDLRPPPSVPDPLGHVAARTGDGAGGLGDVRQAVTEYERAPLGSGRRAFRAAAATMSALQPSRRPPLQVELRFDLDVRLPDAVGRELERVASGLWQMSRGIAQGHMAEYYRDFLDRYGTEQPVPIMELLDPNRGLDAPAGYQVPPSTRELRRQHPSQEETDRAAVVAELAWAAALRGDEIVLDKDAVARLTGRPPQPPAALEMCVQLFAPSTEALDRGDFTMALSPVGGFTRPGSMAGRFADILGVAPALAEVVSRAAPHGVAVQVMSYPATARSANVANVPRLADTVLPVGVITDGMSGGEIDLADVAVAADSAGFYVVSRETGQELHPFVPHMLNPARELPNAVRLLLDIATSGPGAMPLRWWDWGPLENLPFLPRVRYGRTVLTSARWRPDGELARSREPWPQWCERLAAWRSRWRVPAMVEATIRDHRVELDLDVDLHRQVLRHELRRNPDVVVSESLSMPRSGLNWLDGHAAEFVVQLHSRPEPRPSPRAGHRPTNRVPVRHEPGGEWLYAKLYAAEQTHDELLAEELPALLGGLPEGIDRWFFIRYRDPDPHLRLRLHGDPGVVRDFLPCLRDWASRARDGGLLRRLALDTYEPEIERYGGAAAMVAAERLFCVDSAAVIGHLQLRAGALRHLPVEVLAAMNMVDLLHALGGPDWMTWFVHEIRLPPVRGIERAHRALVDPEGSWEAIAALPGAGAVVARRAERVEAAAGFGRLLPADGRPAIVRSVLHMHANRLMGVRKPREAQALAIVRERAHSLLARRSGS